jgi:hypothetical protein
MTVTTVKRDARGAAPADKPREPGQGEAASFGKLLRRRRRAPGADGEDSPQADGLQPAFAGGWPLASNIPGRDGAREGRAAARRTVLGAAAVPELPAGVEGTVQTTRSGGAEISLRFTNGPWAGLEMQAALHAGEVVVKLRPANRLQQRRLTEASASLTGQIREQTGEAVQLEIADATR